MSETRENYLVIPSRTKTVEYQTVDLTPLGFDWCDMGLRAIGEPTFEQWEQVGILLRLEHAQLSRRATKVQFALGDWLNYGERAWGDEIWNVLDASQYAYETIRNFKSVADRIPPSLRNDALSYQHHVAVAPLETPEQRGAWLERAERDQLSAAALREQVQAKRGVPPSTLIVCPHCQSTFDISEAKRAK